MARVPTLLYARTLCEDPDSMSQLACSDDAPDTTRSAIEREFEAGIYYVVVDYHEYTRGGTSFVCGTVRFTITEV